mmetsp:Transcript_67962/g.162227  ORF Transcript_67962/g.162227 Transcript_67962/m.162227 type:complete len:109 (-) Transcript_67962:44-370(-)
MDDWIQMVLPWWAQLGSFGKDGRLRQLGLPGLLVTALLGLSLSVLVWGRTDQCLQDRRPEPSPKEAPRSLGHACHTPQAPQAPAAPGEDEVFWDILNQYQDLMQDSPR